MNLFDVLLYLRRINICGLKEKANERVIKIKNKLKVIKNEELFNI